MGVHHLRWFFGLVFSFPKCINKSRCDEWLTRYDVPKLTNFGILQKFKKITYFQTLVFVYIPQFLWSSGVLDPKDAQSSCPAVIARKKWKSTLSIVELRWAFYKIHFTWRSMEYFIFYGHFTFTISVKKNISPNSK